MLVDKPQGTRAVVGWGNVQTYHWMKSPFKNGEGISIFTASHLPVQHPKTQLIMLSGPTSRKAFTGLPGGNITSISLAISFHRFISHEH